LCDRASVTRTPDLDAVSGRDDTAKRIRERLVPDPDCTDVTAGTDRVGHTDF